MNDHICDPSGPVFNERRAMLAGLGGLAAGALLASTANAGPLTPPPGPISSTPGPEPRIPINQTNTPGTAGAVFRITQGGSYYLTANFQVPSGLVGIEIAQSDVAIDLNGFTIAGLLNTSSDGIAVSSVIARRNITIRNGSIVTCGGAGINLTSSSHNAVEHIHVRGNTGDGIRSGDCSRVIDCSALDNGGKGILTGQNAIVENCIAQGSGGNGIIGCVARFNTQNGITAFNYSMIIGNNCRSHTKAAGIQFAGPDNRVEDNNCIDNATGILATEGGNYIARNTCSGNTTQNWNIAASNACLVVNAPASSAINGNSGGTPSGTSDPLANFTV